MQSKNEINLLPLPQQRIRLQGIYLNRLGRLINVSISITLLLALVLGANHAVTYYIGTTIEKAVTTPSSNTDGAAAEVDRLNKLIAATDRWHTNHQVWSSLVVDALAVAPVSVHLTVIDVDQEQEKLTLEGDFSSRAAVAQYREVLADLPWVKELEAPLSNFATGNDVKFIFELTRAGPNDSQAPTP